MPSTVFSFKKEVTFKTGSEKSLRLVVNGASISVPVDVAVFAHYQNQIYKKNPSQKQEMTFKTVKSLMRAAYLKGLHDGKNMK